jgi:hypothetical protein
VFFFLRISFDNNSIQEAKKIFKQAVDDEQNDDIDLLDIKSANKIVKIFLFQVALALKWRCFSLFFQVFLFALGWLDVESK